MLKFKHFHKDLVYLRSIGRDTLAKALRYASVLNKNKSFSLSEENFIDLVNHKRNHFSKSKPYIDFGLTHTNKTLVTSFKYSFTETPKNEGENSQKNANTESSTEQQPQNANPRQRLYFWLFIIITLAGSGSLAVFYFQHTDSGKLNFGRFLRKLADTTLPYNNSAALMIYETSLGYLRAALGDYDLETANLYEKIAECYGKLGETKKMMTNLGKTLKVRLFLLGSKHLDTAKVLEELGTGYSKLGLYQEELNNYRMAFDARKDQQPLDHEDVLNLMKKQGLAYVNLKRFPEALECFSKILEVRRSKGGDQETAEFAWLYNELGSLYDKLGDHKQGGSYISKALKIRETLFGADSPDTLISKYNLAIHEGLEGKLDRKVALIKQILEAHTKKFGEKHPLTAFYLTELANTYGDMGDVRNQENCSSRALAIAKETLGEADTHTADAYLAASTANRNQGDFEKEVENYRRALEIYEKKYGRGHKKVAVMSGKLAELLLKQGNYNEAVDLVNTALIVLKNESNPETLMIAIMNMHLAKAEAMNGNIAGAKEALESQVNYLIKKGGGHVTYVMGYANEIRALIAQKEGKQQERVNFAKKAVETYQKNLGPRNYATLEARIELSKAYLAANDMKSARKELESLALDTKETFREGRVNDLLAQITSNP